MPSSSLLSALGKFWTALWNPHRRSCSGSACDQQLDWLGQRNRVFKEGDVPSSLVVSGGEVGLISSLNKILVAK